jgi:hypothetical protein
MNGGLKKEKNKEIENRNKIKKNLKNLKKYKRKTMEAFLFY